jgi:uncharacterized protein (TIGR03382 family)
MRLLCVFIAVSTPFTALAFQVQSIATPGCHERITAHALDAAGWPANLVVAENTREDRALADALAFTAPEGWTRPALALLIGARDNDFHGAALGELPELSEVHLGSTYQVEHCLRAPEDDLGIGDEAALAACRAFILGELAQALDGDPNEVVEVTVALRDQTALVPLPRYPFHLGRAMHALQDSFTHTLRSADYRVVHAVFNYVDPALRTDYAAERDGHTHESVLDHCADENPVDAARAAAATTASAELMAAVGDASPSSEARLVRAAALLDDWLEYAPACAAGGAWCDEAQQMLVDSGALGPAGGCAAAPGDAGLVALAAVFVLMFRRRRAVFGFAAGIALIAPPAFSEPALRFTTSAGASIDRGGASIGTGARYLPGGRFDFGLDVELNPWLDVASGKPSLGVVSAYGSAFWRWVDLDGVTVKSSLGLGASVLLFDTVDARGVLLEAGSVGPFASFGALALAVPWGKLGTAEFRPEIVLAVPSVRGVPYVYRQYRFTFTVVWGG